MPRDTGAMTLLVLAAALAVGVLGISERVQSQPPLYASPDASPHFASHSAMQPLHYTNGQESQE